MHRRDLLKLSPLAFVSTAGHVPSADALLPEAQSGTACFDVRRFGATGDGRTVDTPAINRAIDAVAAAGGGTLIFPAGTRPGRGLEADAGLADHPNERP